MANVVALREIELKPGITERDFEQSLREYAAHTPIAGADFRVLKGMDGARGRPCLLPIDFESEERRAQVMPEPTRTEGAKPWWAAPDDKALRDNLRALSTVKEGSFTRYEERCAIRE